MKNELEPKQYGCPVNCEYCVVTKIEARRPLWNKNSLLGINKAVTILNPPRDLENKIATQDFYNFPTDLLRGDYVSFNAISDPFWPKYRKEFEHFLDNVAPVAKLVTCVTKFDPSDEILKRISQIDNFRLVVSITGLDQIEKTKTVDRLNLLERAKKFGIQAFPLIHPYISGMSNLSFLKDLKSLGYENIDLKGLRYNPQTMNMWMPKNVQEIYCNSNEQEILPEDGWLDLINSVGIVKLSLKDWYQRNAPTTPKLTYEAAVKRVEEIVSRANVVSSDSKDAVFEAAVKRRL